MFLKLKMYAYCMAAAHEELPHILLDHYMVSNTEISGEGWKWVDQLADQCQPPAASNGKYFPNKPLPTFLHYCQFFRAGELGFQKRRVYKDIFSCEQSMLLEPQKNLSFLDFKNRDGEYIKVPKKTIKRHSFALCVLHRSLNAALTTYKNKKCKAGKANFNKTINVVLIQKW